MWSLAVSSLSSYIRRKGFSVGLGSLGLGVGLDGEKVFKQHVNTIYLTICLALKMLKHMQQQQQQQKQLELLKLHKTEVRHGIFCGSPQPASLSETNPNQSPLPHTP